MPEPTRRRRKPVSTHEVQAAAEAVDLPSPDATDGTDGRPTVVFLGEEYAIAEEVGAFPIWQFAQAGVRNYAADSPEALAAQYTLLEQCIAPDEWARFARDACDKRAKGNDLYAVITDVLGMLSARPTGSPSDSSTGQPATPRNSKAS